MTLDDFLTDSFVRRQTPFASLADLLAAGTEAGAEVGSPAWDAFIHRNTRFRHWDALLEAAGNEYLALMIGEGGRT